ncbi:hypothetical protein KBD33_04575 [Candidatus Gracilibacteria bacterium]|nr:hypothetical protein [Candidatus Gracilibacteria bacterium]
MTQSFTKIKEINKDIDYLLKQLNKGDLSFLSGKGKFIYLIIASIIFLLYNNGIIPEFVITLIIIGGALIYILGIIKQGDIIESLKDIKEINKALHEEEFQTDKIEMIYEKIGTIYGIITKLHSFKILKPEKFRIEKKGELIDISKEFENFLQNELLFLVNYISDLRSDLSIRLAEQKNLLEGAKGEVEKIEQTPLPPLSGGLETGLMQVSELQKSRLDKQIKQFEELQRVLVKV